MTTTHDDKLKLRASNRALVLKLLASYGIGECRIAFDGSGDSGSIQEITLEGIADGEMVLTSPVKERIMLMELVFDPKLKHYAQKAVASGNYQERNGQPYTMRDLLTDWAYDALEKLSFDWVNNDGGYGTVIVRPGAANDDPDADEAVVIEGHARITTSRPITNVVTPQGYVVETERGEIEGDD